MEIHKQIEKKAGEILSAFQASGLNLIVTGKNSLRITGKATTQQIENLRKWKTHIINLLSPECSNCTLPLQLINNGTLWFCPFGCESRKKEK